MSNVQSHYYSARKVPGDVTDWYRVVKNYDITFVFSTILYRPEGLYEYMNGHYYLHLIDWEDFDLLTAFGVPSQHGFNNNASRILQ
jgi:hypothetical protein